MSQGLIPATILTGFLGSGKTTLLKRVLSENHGKKIAVIENEFGEENIDNEILVDDAGKEQILQLSNGCVCCTIREDLRSTLTTLAEKKRKGELDFDRVVIETTGLADPGPVAQTFRRRAGRSALPTRSSSARPTSPTRPRSTRWCIASST